MLPNEWDERVDAALRKVQESVNGQLARQYQQLVDSLHDFLDDLFNYPLVEDWRRSLARFAEHWADRGLILTERTIAALEQLIEQRIGGSVAVMLAEAPAADPLRRDVATDATLPMSPAPASSGSPPVSVPSRTYELVASQLGRQEQLRLGLTDEERKEYERFIVEGLHAQATGAALPLPPFAYWEKHQQMAAILEEQPQIRSVTREEQERSILNWKYMHLDQLPPDEQEKLRLVALIQQRREFADKYGVWAAFLNPAFDGTGTLNDWSTAVGGFAIRPPSREGRPLASRARGPRGVRNRSQQVRERDLPVRQPRKKAPKKPFFPPPVSNPRVTKRRGKKTPHPSHVIAAKSEEQAARAIHKLPGEVVIYWGAKIGAHGPDVVSYNLKTKTVTLWDVKWRGSPRSIQRSRTFKHDSDALANALEIAKRAINSSRLSEADKLAAWKSIEKGTFQTRTLGMGQSKNSTFGDHHEVRPQEN